MKQTLPAREALHRLLAAAWDSQELPNPENIPWQEMLPLLQESNLRALVHVVTQGIRCSIPQSVQQTLQETFYRTQIGNTRILHQLGQVWEELSKNGTPLLLLKGAALTQTLYRDSTLRRIGDIDLLVNKVDVPACKQILMEMGYTPSRVEHQAGSLLQHSNQEMFLPSTPYQCPVELHWHILDVPYYMHHIPMDWFWQNSETLNISGNEIQVLNTEANLVYLPAHLAFHHRFYGLHSYVDLGLLVFHHQDSIDWQNVVSTAHAFELSCALGGTLERLSYYWPRLPIDEPLRYLAELDPSKADARLYRLLTAEMRTTTLDFYTTLISLPNFSSRAQYAWVNLFPQPAYMQGRYKFNSLWQLPYWYLYRMLEGVLHFLRTFPVAHRINHESK